MHPQSHPWRRILSPLSVSLLFFHSGSMGVDALGLIVGPHGLWLSQCGKKVLLCSVVLISLVCSLILKYRYLSIFCCCFFPQIALAIGVLTPSIGVRVRRSRASGELSGRVSSDVWPTPVVGSVDGGA